MPLTIFLADRSVIRTYYCAPRKDADAYHLHLRIEKKGFVETSHWIARRKAKNCHVLDLHGLFICPVH